MLCPHNADVKRDVRFYSNIYLRVNQAKTSKIAFKDPMKTLYVP